MWVKASRRSIYPIHITCKMLHGVHTGPYQPSPHCFRMLYVLLTVLSSVLVSVVLKVNETRGGHRFVVAGTNYMLAALLALIAGYPDDLHIAPQWIGISALAGLGFISGFWLLMVGLKEIGLAIPTSAARLSMLVPVSGSILLLGEQPGVAQIAGIAAGVAAFALLGLAQRGAAEPMAGERRLNLRALLILVTIFCIVGTTDFTMKLAQYNGVSGNAMALVIFITASLICWGIVAAKRPRVAGRDILTGVALGIPNYFSVYFLLAALRHLDASAVFPTVSAGAVVTITLVAVTFWRERPNRTAWMGIALAALAVALLGLKS